GQPDLSNFRPSANEAVCNDCGGLGKVRKGSPDPRYEAKKCCPAAGKGYLNTRPRQHEEAEPPASDAAGNGQQIWHDDGTKRDMFGTPETDPDYGLMPNMRARPTDYWQAHRD